MVLVHLLAIGKKIIVCNSINTNDNLLHYTLDGGKTWKNGPAIANVTYTGRLNYIGNNKFFVEKTSSSGNYRGEIWIWDATHPSTYYKYNFSSEPTLEINNIWECNSDSTTHNYYVSVGHTNTECKTYVGTDYITASTQVQGLPNYYIATHPVFIYNKYFVVANQRDAISDGTVYVSTDGINFSTTNVAASSIYKMNGKLCFRASGKAGIIKQDYSTEYTTFSGSEISNIDNSTILCNRFPKM